MKVAALDLGSNTFLCLIGEVATGRITRVYADEVEVVRLGQGLNESGRFHPDALRRADRCLEKFALRIAEHRPEKILAMATSAARDAANRDELFAIAEKHGIPLEIIPGEREAEITYQGAVSGLATEAGEGLLVLDIGGGSTEFIFGRGSQLLAGESHDIGCVRLTERFISAQPTPAEDIRRVTEFIDQAILRIQQKQPAGFHLDRVLAVAGTPTALAAAELGGFDPERVDGYRLTREALRGWLRKLVPATVAEKINFGIPAGRADVILIGVITLLRTLEIFNLPELTVSTRGVRYGVALEMARRFQS